jgi:DNA-binding CsgD family transcriptional regulator
MSLRGRPMRSGDVAECVEIIKTHPVIGQRYAGAIADLRAAWLRVVGCEASTSLVLEEGEGSHATICFVGLSVFVSDDFVREIKRPPLHWFGPVLAKRISQGDSPLLSGSQVREANTCRGLNLLVWEGCFRPEFEQEPAIRKVMSAFLDDHRGYLWKELVSSQMESAERLQWTLKSGCLPWNPTKGSYVDSLQEDPAEFIRKPHILGVTRDADRSRFGSWVGALFDYHPPRMGLSPGEQRLLLAALSGETDEKLAEELGVSPSTVKNTWRSIYNRVASVLPELFSDDSAGDSRAAERGKEKRRHLLAYLREHLEELRPISRRLLQKATR